MYKFAAAWEQESIVFGASKPGYSHQKVLDWVNFMQHKNIKRVCCLLPEEQLDPYTNLLGIYQQEFGSKHVCWAPVKDFHLCDLETLTQKILPFLITAEKQSEKVVVHCSGGIGRTGHVLAAWLVSVRGFSNKDAIAAVKRTGRNPYEAVIASVFTLRNPFQIAKELNSLLNDCRLAYTTSVGGGKTSAE
ncbi:MAG: dual specificity protein phosphatase family protein [Stigonema ocellatum SAG 48.90 = DSM 106950]|nr:dual specificity protein phosphatase family protein [Stigonema ocellatum SAG 48.90 = DSM 106950]